LADKHHRVAANAVYGLYLLDAANAKPEIERLLGNQVAAFRCAGAWVVRKIGSTDLRGLLKSLIGDGDPKVRRSCFQALLAFTLVQDSNNLN
jgi:hypothetical protein